jgi:molybdopterin molybdotransferase
MAGGLIPLADAQAQMLALMSPGPIVHLPLNEASGWLAEPLFALRNQPFADLSAMDGFALGDGDGPWHVKQAIAAEQRAPSPLAAGEAARIFTGAPLPGGADRILLQEEASVDGHQVSANSEPVAGQWIRRRASDFATGETLAAVGAAITPALRGLAAIAGHATLACRPVPACHLLATGSELVDAVDCADHPLALPSATGPMLNALLASLGGTVNDGGIVADDLGLIMNAIGAFEHDHVTPGLLLLTGGASVGDHDLVRPALEQAGWTISLHRIALKPGKPLMVAHKGANGGGRHIALGLPGNPVSAYVTALLFALPLLRHAAGCPAPLPVHRPAILGAPVAAGGGRLEYLRGTIDDNDCVAPLPSQDSASLRTLATAQVLIRIDIDQAAKNVGDPVDIIAIA